MGFRRRSAQTRPTRAAHASLAASGCHDRARARAAQTSAVTGTLTGTVQARPSELVPSAALQCPLCRSGARTRGWPTGLEPVTFGARIHCRTASTTASTDGATTHPHTPRGTAEQSTVRGDWLARKDSNLQSPDPEMDERFGPLCRPLEHERLVSISRFRDELSAHPELNHLPKRNGPGIISYVRAAVPMGEGSVRSDSAMLPIEESMGERRRDRSPPDRVSERAGGDADDGGRPIHRAGRWSLGAG